MAEWFEGVKQDFIQTFITGDRWQSMLEGLGTTLLITLCALVIGVVLGIIIAAVRSTHDQMAAEGKKNPILTFFNKICEIYLAVIRGTPVMVQLLIMYFVTHTSSSVKDAICFIQRIFYFLFSKYPVMKCC